MSVFFGRNVMAETQETETYGNTVLNKRPMRQRITEVIGELNDFDRLMSSYVENQEVRNILRDKLKVSKGLINAL